ncbi:MAG: Cys-tRNA(Pro) deacylase [Actinomycetota bacterium]
MTPAIVALERAGVAHRVLSYEHDPGAEAYGTEAAEALGLDPAGVHKTLVVALAGGTHGVGLVPVTSQLDLKACARALGAKKATMAETRDAERLTGYVVGGISPLGQRRRLPTAVDEAAASLPEIFVSAGRRGLEIGLAPEVLVDLLDAALAPLAS